MSHSEPMTSVLVTRTTGTINTADRARLLGQQGRVVWFTGLSGSGKSTLSQALEARLIAMGRPCYVLDGDNLRHGLCRDLGFSDRDRNENIRRAGEVAALFADAGLIAIAAFISPFTADRDRARAAVAAGAFCEVFLSTSLATCEARDPKGLYRKARAGNLVGFTGIDAPYQAPTAPDATIDTSQVAVDDAVDRILATLHQGGAW